MVVYPVLVFEESGLVRKAHPARLLRPLRRIGKPHALLLSVHAYMRLVTQVPIDVPKEVLPLHHSLTTLIFKGAFEFDEVVAGMNGEKLNGQDMMQDIRHRA